MLIILYTCHAYPFLLQQPKNTLFFFLQRSVSTGQMIACEYCKTRELTNYEPSMLPAPENGLITMGPHDVAIVFKRQHQHWEFQEFYHSRSLNGMYVYQCQWVIVVTENGPQHYTWQRWVPSLDSLKEGPLVEATISWRNLSQQLKFQREHEEKKTSDHRRHLQLSSEKVLMTTSDNKLQRGLIQQLFWKSDASDRKLDQDKYWSRYPRICNYYPDDDNDDNSNKSLVVTWGPETGGLTGNQVTDGDSAQISLLPGIKYHVRVASNDGPGSFPIVIDTRHVDNHAPPLPPSSSTCQGICRSKIFTFAGWQYFLALSVITVLLYCYILVDSWLMRKSEQTWEKA